jgi:DNA polymerase-3 subunit alpha
MPHADFVHLRAHSAYSLSEGAIKVEKLPALAREAQMPAVAITDTANLFGALEFSQACVAKGIQPIIGCSLALTRADNPRLAPEQIVLLAQDQTGLANLQRLSSFGFLDTDPGQKPQLTFDRIAQHAAGLILLTGGTTGPLGRLLADGQRDEAARLLRQFAEAFPDRTVVELHRHGLPLEAAIEPGMIALADTLSLPLVATNDCLFATQSMFEAHDALLCIAEGRLLSEPDRRRVTSEHWFKPAADMRALFADLPEACDNTLAIARRCAVMMETRKPLLPVCPKVREGATEEATVRAMAIEGLDRRMDAVAADAATRARYRERLDYELGVIASMGFSGYFLIVADFIQWAKAQGIPVGPGRGSGAGSVAAWALTITDVDPIRFNLLFERFLNPERVSMPDFDIDFCQEGRDRVIDYVRGEYGADRVAQIITFGKLQARAAVRDVGRVLGLPFGQVNKVAELIPNNPAKPVTLQQAVDGEQRLQQLRDDDEGIARLLEIALQIEGLYRHASTHAAGVVIGDRPLSELVPLYRDPRSEFLVTQYSMKYVEQAGLVKFDFLGLTTLTILKRAQGLLHGLEIDVDLNRLPLDDSKTYEMLAKGDAGGVFQIEGQGARDMLRQMRPDRFEDLVAAVALYRPGPMDSIPEYCRRKHAGVWEAPHPEIHDILAETYGIIVYQEQVMQIAQKMAGYSLGGADLLRRAMGKKIPAEMEAQRDIFMKGAVARGIDPDKATEVFGLMAKFAGYGFNKCHAAPYGLLAYQTAWLKANHPEVFIAACMSLALGNTDRLAALKQEAERAGSRILPPDINRSLADFSVERCEDGKLGIRYALAAIKKVGLVAMQGLVAFDSMEPNRARLFSAAETILRRAAAQAEERESGQIAMFGSGGGQAEPLRLQQTPNWPPLEQLAFESEAIGFHLTAHPLDAYAQALRRLGVIACAQVETAAQSGAARVKLAGNVVAIKERVTRTGSRMAWVRLSDASGSCEVTLFSEVLSRARDMVADGANLLVTADLRLEGEALRVTAQDVAPLDQAAAAAGASMRVWLRETATVPHIRDLLSTAGGGRGRVVLVPRLGAEQSVEIALPGGFNVTPRLAQALKLLPGVEQVEEL